MTEGIVFDGLIFPDTDVDENRGVGAKDTDCTGLTGTGVVVTGRGES